MKRKIVSIFLMVILLLTVTMPAIFAQTAQERKQELENKLNDVKDAKQEVTTKKNSVLDEIGELDSQIEEYETEITKLNKKITDLKKSIDKNEKEIKKLEKEFKEKEEAFVERMVAIYEDGQTTYLDMLLSSDNIVSFISSYYMISELAEADKAMMDSIQQQQSKIEETKKELENEKQEIVTSKNKIEEKTKTLNNAKSSKQSKVNSLTAQEKKLQAKIDEFNSAIKEAQKEIDKAIKNSSGYQGSFSGTLSWPVSTSSYGYNIITSGYGRRDQPTAGASTSHKALDIGISYQTVYAPADGYIVTAGWQSGYGNFIMIKHSNSLYTCYGHLSGYKVSSGQTVTRGQAIATSGNTGVSTGPHLHFEVRTNGSYDSRVNPLNYISDSVYSKLIFW